MNFLLTLLLALFGAQDPCNSSTPDASCAEPATEQPEAPPEKASRWDSVADISNGF
jgi:hypothetical protein